MPRLSRKQPPFLGPLGEASGGEIRAKQQSARHQNRYQLERVTLERMANVALEELFPLAIDITTVSAVHKQRGTNRAQHMTSRHQMLPGHEDSGKN